jgi:hypothetical protein
MREGMKAKHSPHQKEWSRQVPYAYTECLAHVEVVEWVSDRSPGFLASSSTIQPVRRPSSIDYLQYHYMTMSMKWHLNSWRMDQGNEGFVNLLSFSLSDFSISTIQDRNGQMIEARAYRDMHLYGSAKANFRYQLLVSNHSTLYRKFSRKLGVDVWQPPQYNIEEWLNLQSPNFQSTVYKAIFHYSS